MIRRSLVTFSDGGAVMEKERSPIWKFLGGLALGVGLTYAYVRFGYSLPSVLKLGEKVKSNAIVTTADVDLYDHKAPLEVRQRALAVVVGQQPELFIEIDNATNHVFLEDVLRRKAVRRAKLAKGSFDAYDVALDKPALRRFLEKKHGAKDTDTLKRRMLIAAIQDDEYLHRYLRARFQQATRDELADLVLNVYRNGLKPQPSMTAKHVDRNSDRVQ